jgi:DNA-binding transcriptional regulator YhcF (GntR family)
LLADVQAFPHEGGGPVRTGCGGSRKPHLPRTLQTHYAVPGLNTIRQAQALLVDDGLIETRQGRGAYLLRTRPRPRPVDLLAELRAARTALNRAIAALEKAAGPG